MDQNLGSDFEKYTLTSDAQQRLQEEASSLARVADTFTTSMIDAGVKTPYNGIAQIVNKVATTEVMQMASVAPAHHLDSSKGEWWASTIGSGVGMAADLYLLSKIPGVKKAFGGFPANAAGTAETLSVSMGNAAAKGAIAGIAYEGLFRPTAPDENFLAGRLRNAATGGIIFGSASALGVGINAGMERFATRGALDVAARQVSSSALSGLGGGFIGAHTNSLMRDGNFADANTVQRSMLEFAVVNTALTGAHALEGHLFGKEAKPAVDTRAAVQETGRMTGLEGLGRPSSLPGLASEGHGIPGRTGVREPGRGVELKSGLDAPKVTGDAKGNAGKVNTGEDAVSWARSLEAPAPAKQGPMKTFGELQLFTKRNTGQGDPIIGELKGQVNNALGKLTEAETTVRQTEQSITKEHKAENIKIAEEMAAAKTDIVRLETDNAALRSDSAKYAQLSGAVGKLKGSLAETHDVAELTAKVEQAESRANDLSNSVARQEINPTGLTKPAADAAPLTLEQRIGALEQNMAAIGERISAVRQARFDPMNPQSELGAANARFRAACEPMLGTYAGMHRYAIHEGKTPMKGWAELVADAKTVGQAEGGHSRLSADSADVVLKVDAIVAAKETVSAAQKVVAENRTALEGLQKQYLARQELLYSEGTTPVAIGQAADGNKGGGKQAGEGKGGKQNRDAVAPAKAAEVTAPTPSGKAPEAKTAEPTKPAEKAPEKARADDPFGGIKDGTPLEDVLNAIRSKQVTVAQAELAVNDGRVIPTTEVFIQSLRPAIDAHIRQHKLSQAIDNAVAADKAAASARADARAAQPVARQQVDGKLSNAERAVGEYGSKGNNSYIRPLKALAESAQAARQHMSSLDAAGKQQMLETVVPKLESLMDGLKGSRRGADNGRGLSDARHAKQVPLEQRLNQIADHLDARMKEANRGRDAATQAVASNPVIQQLVAEAAPGGAIKKQLYELSAEARADRNNGKPPTPEQVKLDGDKLAAEVKIALFDKQGKMIQVEDRGGGGRRYALLLDLADVQNGLSPQLAARLQNQDIAGSAAFRPRFGFNKQGGQGEQLSFFEIGGRPGGKGGGQQRRGPVHYERTLLQTTLDVPAQIRQGTSLGQAIAEFSAKSSKPQEARPQQQRQERPAENRPAAQLPRVEIKKPAEPNPAEKPPEGQ